MRTRSPAWAGTIALALVGLAVCCGCVPNLPAPERTAAFTSNVAQIADVAEAVRGKRAEMKSVDAMVEFAKLMRQGQGTKTPAGSRDDTSARALSELTTLLRNQPNPTSSAGEKAKPSGKSLAELRGLLTEEPRSAATRKTESPDPAAALSELTALLRQKQGAAAPTQEVQRKPADILLELIAALRRERDAAGAASTGEATPTAALLALVELMQRERADREARSAAERTRADLPRTATQGEPSGRPAPAAPIGTEGTRTEAFARTPGTPPRDPRPVPRAGTAREPAQAEPPVGGIVVRKEPPADVGAAAGTAAGPDARALHPNIILGPDGKRRPAPGYRWVSDHPKDLRVVPKAGTPHPEHPNVVGNQDGRWVPAPGYKWMTDAEEDFRVVPKETTGHLACNQWEDLNKDGRATHDEFKGIKKTFRSHERLELAVCYNLRCKGKTIAYKLWGPDGSIVLEDSLKCEHDSVVWPIQMRGHLMDYLVNRAGLGSYRFAGYLDDTYVGSCDFEITH